jgi:hypothetical protein
MKRIIVKTALVLTVSLVLTSCGTSAPKIDVCKKIMGIVGRYSDLQLKALSDPLYSTDEEWIPAYIHIARVGLY